MRGRFRDLVVTLAVLVVLFGALVLINPRVREHFESATAEVQSDGWAGPQHAVGAAGAAVSITTGYAQDNPFLFSFAIVAVVLFMLMLRT